MGQVFLMTDKKETKDCACTYPGCENFCRVNTFYAPAKARCPDHGGKAMKRLEGETPKFEEQAVTVVASVKTPPLPDNRKLGKLFCPICKDSPLEIIACTDAGHIDFGCQTCQTIVSITFNFRPAQMRSVPERLHDLVRAFNIKQVGTMDVSLAHKLDASLPWGHRP